MVESHFLRELPIPPHYDPAKVKEVWKVSYQQRSEEAFAWARRYQIQPASKDKIKICLIVVDAQNSFCIPEFELFVSGRSGMGAVEDNHRLCEFIYHNLSTLTQIMVTLDTHKAVQIFHSIFLVDEHGEHPTPFTLVSYQDIISGRWKFNPEIAASLDIDASYGQQHLIHYARELRDRQKYDLTVWPYHVMLGSIGHALVASVEEAIFFHTFARYNQVDFELKGNNPLTEHYSAIGPEVIDNIQGEAIAQKEKKFIQKVIDFDAVLIAGQAKSHCVAWTVEDLLSDIHAHDESLANKVYLLEDCTSPVVIPGVVDYTDQAETAFKKFAEAGMHVVRSTDPMRTWPGMSSFPS